VIQFYRVHLLDASLDLFIEPAIIGLDTLLSFATVLRYEDGYVSRPQGKFLASIYMTPWLRSFVGHVRFPHAFR